MSLKISKKAVSIALALQKTASLKCYLITFRGAKDINYSMMIVYKYYYIIIKFDQIYVWNLNPFHYFNTVG